VNWTERLRQFCDEYLVDFNGTQAAIRAGYSKKTARSIANRILKMPEIRKRIDERLAEVALSRLETIKLVSDIAHSSLNDYFKIEQRPQRQNVKRSLRELIVDLQNDIEDAEIFLKRAKITNADAIDAYNKQQQYRKDEIMRLEIQLERNPGAYVISLGPEVLVPVAELDLVKLVKDKERGKIKSITPTEHGVKVEMYAADAALRDMLKVHGAYAPEKSEHTGKDGAPLLPALTDDQFEKLITEMHAASIKTP
jgi:phage terminase small subunit